MKTIHLIGVGGSGMSALARFFLAQGFHVSGSDQSQSATTQDLQNHGLCFFKNHAASNLPPHCDLVVYSLAVPANNPERLAATQNQVRQLSYFESLGKFLKEFELVAIAGTHGKTTTTALATLTFLEHNLDPTVFVGSSLPFLPEKNFRLGKSKYAIVEACEYQRNFLSLRPTHLIITTLDYDHPDTYASPTEYQNAFAELVKCLPTHGTLILPADCPACQTLAQHSPAPIFYFSASDLPTDFSLSVPGQHNRHNASSILTLAKHLQLPTPTTLTALQKYTGADRRFQTLGTKLGATFITDYAHHPLEIQATLAAAHELYPKQKITAVFQPHQFSRTRQFLAEFTTSFTAADQVLITDIFAARDTAQDLSSVSTAQLVTAIQAQHTHTLASGDLAQTATHLRQNTQPGEVILLLGAGTIPQVYDLI